MDPTQFLYSGNQVYVAELYERYLDDPHSVDHRWQDFFASLEDDARDLMTERRGASWAPSDAGVLNQGELETLSEQMSAGQQLAADRAAMAAPVSSGRQVREATMDSIRALMLIRAYRVRGHLRANLDPLGLQEREENPELDPMSYGFQDKDLDRPIFINYVLGLEQATMREIMRVLEQTYCGSIGVEFMHIQDPDEKSWIQERIERIRNQPEFTVMGKKAILNRLIETEGFEKFLDKKFTGTKRFGLDGGESLVPAMEQIFKRGSQLGIEEIVLGMAHRGRLNVLANVMGKPFQAIFHEFQGGSSSPDDVGGSGDVKYHLGSSSDRVFDGRSVHLSLTANPSHLECVNTVCLGKVRAKQRQRNDSEREKVMALLLHGDAAFAGQAGPGDGSRRRARIVGGAAAGLVGRGEAEGDLGGVGGRAVAPGVEVELRRGRCVGGRVHAEDELLDASVQAVGRLSDVDRAAARGVVLQDGEGMVRERAER